MGKTGNNNYLEFLIPTELPSELSILICDTNGFIGYVDYSEAVVTAADRQRWDGKQDEINENNPLDFKYLTNLPSFVTDVIVNGESVVKEDHTVELTIPSYSSGEGITIGTDNSISIDLSEAQELNPKEINIGEQNKHSIVVMNQNGKVEKLPVGNLDYTRLKVVNTDDLSVVGVNDFIFLEEN